VTKLNFLGLLKIKDESAAFDLHSCIKNYNLAKHWINNSRRIDIIRHKVTNSDDY